MPDAADGPNTSGQSAEQQQAEAQSSSSVFSISAAFQGPLPPPGFLEKYEQICPGAADRLLTLLEKQTSHRHHQEHKALTASIVDAKDQRAERNRGQTHALIIALVSLIAAAFCSYNGHEKAAIVIGSGTILLMATAFAYGAVTRWLEDKEKQTENEGKSKSDQTLPLPRAPQPAPQLPPTGTRS